MFLPKFSVQRESASRLFSTQETGAKETLGAALV
jgi:hypothetical protein